MLPEELGDCPDCGNELLHRINRKTKKAFVSCSAYPECTYARNFDEPDIHCELCETGWMRKRNGKNGPFLGCSNYPDCRNTAKIDVEVDIF